MKRLLHNEASLRYEKYNLKLIDNYINRNTPVKAMCFCGNEFICKPESIFTGDRKSCGCLVNRKSEYNIIINQQIAEERYLKKNLLLLDKYINNVTKLKTLCFCGREFMSIPSVVFKSHNTACNECVRHKMSTSKLTINIGEKYGNLLVLDTHKQNNVVIWKCLCDCGNIAYKSTYCIKNNLEKVCSIHCTLHSNDITNKSFGELTAIKLYDISEIGNARWLCLCKCGKKKIILRNSLLTGCVKSCGKCKKFHNGRLYSVAQLNIFNELQQGVFNYRYNRYCIDIALVYKGKKFAIEYDCRYWHKKNKIKDIKKYKFLQDNKWNVIQILADIEIPTRQEIIDVIDNMSKTNNNFVRIHLQ